MSQLDPLSLWDLGEPAESARPQLPSLTDTLVCEAATIPPLAELTIICEHLPWKTVVHPTPEALWSWVPFVTVGDVLYRLYRALRLGVTEHEMGTLEPAQRDRVRDAYTRRYRRVADPAVRAEEKAKGVKRVDFLRRRIVF